MTRRPLRRGAMGAVAVVAALCATVPVADVGDAQEAPDPDPILAIVSPIAAGVCSTAGTATLLVPIVGGLVESTLGLDGSISVGDVILDSLGPIYIVCGSLPEPPGTRCLLDDQIAGLVPAEVSDTTGPLPPVLGGLVDSLVATLTFLGLDATDALAPALQCDVRTPDAAAEAPDGAAPPAVPPSAPSAPTVAPPAIGPAAPTLGGLPPALAPAVPSTPPAATGSASPQTLVDVIARSTPEWVRNLQVLVAGALGLFLLASWATSLRVARRLAA